MTTKNSWSVGGNRFAIVFAALTIAASSGCGVEEAVAEPERPRPVLCITTYAVGTERVLSFSGAAKTGRETKLSFKVNGTLSSLNVIIADAIRKGQLIAQIDPIDYEVQVMRVEALLARAKAQAASANADLERIRNLYERNRVPLSNYNLALGHAGCAQANVQSIEKQLEQAKLQVSYCKLYSPQAGSVTDVPVVVNENVAAGRPIVVLNIGSFPEVEVSIPETLISEIAVGAAVQSVAFDAIPDRVFRGIITGVAVAPSKGLSTYPVTIQLQGADPRIFPGMAGEVSISFGASGQPPRHVLPPNAVGEDREGHFVFVVKPGEGGLGVIERRSVEVGRLSPSDGSGNGLEILSGLNNGEIVVTAGISKIIAGQEVELSDEYKDRAGGNSSVTPLPGRGSRLRRLDGIVADDVSGHNPERIEEKNPVDAGAPGLIGVAAERCTRLPRAAI